MTVEAEDREIVVEEGEWLGGPVDPPVEAPTVYGTITRFQAIDRTPIVPAWLRNRDQRAAFVRESARYVGYVAGYHAARSHVYGTRVALRAPVGAGKAVWSLGRWVFDREGLHARLESVRRADAAEYLNLSRQRDRRIRSRLLLASLGGLALIVGGGLLSMLAPWWLLIPAAGGSLTGLARLGTPPDRPLVDRVQTGPKFVRLTAEQVRTALCNIGLSGIKEPGSVTFPNDIHRDGPGWIARVNLPAGVEAVDVLERRGKLSSALRLPVDQVWPSAGPDHAGQLDLWVGYLPASKMGQPKWSLAEPTARTSVFEAYEFGTDERQRPVITSLFARNFLIGGVPGSGKSYGARTLAMIAALDPTCEMKIAEFKGTGDFMDLAPLCSTYACGVDDSAFETGMSILDWGLAEATRRGKRIEALRRTGEAPEGKVTPELAARKGSGLHPVFILIDEAHELFGDSEVGKGAAIAAERLIKRGRALGIIVVLATQIPDRNSLPPIITRCVNVRWCLAVQDHIANDMILGTGAYKRGMSATVYRPGDDAGWGIMTGIGQAGPVRSHFPDPATTKSIIDRATVLRGGVVGGRDDQLVHRDVLADVRGVFYAGEAHISWPALAARLCEQHPQVYAGMTAEAISARVRAFGIASTSVRDAKNFESGVGAGFKLEALEARIAAREITDRKP